MEQSAEVNLGNWLKRFCPSCGRSAHWMDWSGCWSCSYCEFEWRVDGDGGMEYGGKTTGWRHVPDDCLLIVGEES